MKVSGKFKIFIVDKFIFECEKDYFVEFIIIILGCFYVFKIEEIVKCDFFVNKFVGN